MSSNTPEAHISSTSRWVGLGRPEDVVRARGRPADHQLGTEAGVVGVLALVVRRVGAHREQRRQPDPDPVQDPHALLVGVHRDVHVAAAAEVLGGGEAEAVEHPLEPSTADQVGGRLHRGGPRGDQPGSGLPGGGRGQPTPGADVLLELTQVRPGRGVGLHLLPLELTLHTAARRVALAVGQAGLLPLLGRGCAPQDPFGHGQGPATLGVDDEQLFLDSHGASHGPRAPCGNRGETPGVQE